MESQITSASLMTSAERLQAILDTVADGILTVNDKGVIETVNPAAEKIFGYQSEEMIGRNVSMLMPNHHANHHDRYLTEFVDGERTHILGMKRELMGQRKDGSLFPLEIAVDVACVSDRRIFTGILRDISELKKREDALRMSEERLRATVESALDSIIVIDADGRIVEFNPAAERCFGFTREQAIGELLSHLIVPPRLRAAHQRGMQRFNATGQGSILGKRIEVEALRADGSEFRVELAIETASHDDGTLFVAYLRDITARYEQEQALQQAKTRAEEANRAKADFLAMMSHEIRTPLNGVLGILGLLDDTDLDGQQAKYVETARQSGEGLLDIISDILDFSKMEAGKLAFEVYAFDLAPIMQSVIDILHTKADALGTTLTLHMTPDVPQVITGDPGRLRQVILNLVSNAVKFTEHGQVSLTVKATELPGHIPSLCFAVKDTGIGMSLDQQKKLFTEFTTLDPSYSRKYGGTGLGLAITKKLVDAMDGEIQFESEPGRGSLFQVTIPVHAVDPSDAAVFTIKPPPPQDMKPDRKLRILLAEDNPTNRMVARSMLIKAGHQVDTAENGLEAVTAVRRRPYDVVLMDISMPGMDGFQATAAIRKLPDGEGKVPIIAMTAHAMMGDREEILASGMDDYLAKPVGSQALMAALARATTPVVPEEKQDEAKADVKVDGAIFDAEVLEALAQETSPDMIPEFIESFFADVPERLGRIDAAVAGLDRASLQMEVHTIGSSAATFGAVALHIQARKIEAMCIEHRMEVACQEVPLLHRLYDQSAAALQGYLQEKT